MEVPPSTTRPPSRTILGPLSTTFTPPTSCATARIKQDNNSIRWLSIGAVCRSDSKSYTLGLDENCYPKGLNDRLSWGRGPAGQVYSPGRVCPAGYTRACTVVRDDRAVTTTGDFNRANLDVWNYLSKGETAEGCCPTGYTCHDQSSSLCQSSVEPTTSFGALDYLGDCAVELSTYYTVSDASSSIYMDARRVVLVHRATEEEDKQFEPPPEPKSTSLSGGAIAGIVVGACAVLALAVLGGFFIFKRRRRNRQQRNGQPGQVQPGGGAVMVNQGPTTYKPELHGSVGVHPMEMSGAGTVRPELQSPSDGSTCTWTSQTPELSGTYVRELPAGNYARHELQGSYLSDPMARTATEK